MEPARQVIREFRWREIIPGLMLARVLRSSLRIPSLAMGLLATILLSLGWQACIYLMLPEGTQFREETSWSPLTRDIEGGASAFAGHPDEIIQYSPKQAWKMLFTAPMIREFDRFVAPVRVLLTQNQTYQIRACWLCGLLWMLLVGGFFAGVICRMAAFDLTSQERYGLLRSMRFVVGKYKSFLGAPLILLATIFTLLIPFFLLGLLTQPFLAPVAALLWGLGFAWAIVVAVVAVTVMFAWPLVWPALASEESDSFDAIGAALGYTSQRPLTYLGYAIAAMFVSGCALLLFSVVMDLAGSLMMTCAGAFADDTLLLRFAIKPIGDIRTTSESITDSWSYLFSFVFQAFVFSAFWTSATGIYLLLRHHVDGAELDDIYRDGSENEKPMPKLAREMGLTGEAASMTSPVAPPAAKAD